MSNLSSSPGIAQRLAVILHALGRAAAARAAKDWSIAPAVLLLWSYLNRLAARFAALTTRPGAGRLRARQGREPVARERPSRPPGLPQGFGWLLRRVPDAIHYRSQLHHLLADKEMAALLAAAPQAGRLLRPLCRMLGIGPDPELPPALFPPRKTPPAPRPHRPPARPDPAGERREGVAMLAGGPLPT